MKFRTFITTLLSVTILLSAYLSPAAVFAQSTPIELSPTFPDEKVDIIKEKIVDGEKQDLDDTLIYKGDNVSDTRYVVFVKKDTSPSMRGIKSVYVDDNIYGEAVAVTVELDGNIEQQLDELEADSDVLAVTQVVRRELSAYPNPPDDTSFGSQWNLDQPSGSTYGIDLLRAWGYLDTEGTNYGGESSVLVAVIDSGVAYENYTKYGPDSWSFGKGTDVTDNIYVNSGETANNDLDDDSNGELNDHYLVSASVPDYCVNLDETSDPTEDTIPDNGIIENPKCDSPSERTKSFFDDVNGFNAIDFERYWSISSSSVNNSSYCTNSPYDTYKCVSPTKTECELGNMPLDFGCAPGDMGHPNDTMGHGTFVANIISAKTDNSTGIAGIASGVTILPIQIFSATYGPSLSDLGCSTDTWCTSGGYSDQVVRAINYAVDAGADIVNMSFGGEGSDPYEELAMDRAYYDDGVLLVAASGNDGNTVVQYPAGYDSVIAVGATNSNGSRVSYSSYGSHLELSAPVGSGILSVSYNCYFDPDTDHDRCMADDSQANMDPNSPSYPPSILTSFTTNTSAGTSFAAPQVAAVAALIKSLNPTWTAEQIRYVLKMSVSKVGSSDFSSSIGYGVLNAYNAVRGVNANGIDITNMSRVFQIRRGTDDLAYTRYSEDHGATWSSWVSSGTAKDRVTMIEDAAHGKLIQGKQSYNRYVMTRVSDNNGDSWHGWQKSGWTPGYVSMLEVSGKIHEVVRSHHNFVSMRTSTNGGSTWSKWYRTDNMRTAGNVAMIYDSSSSRIIQSMMGKDGKLYTRFSTNNGNTWAQWRRSIVAYSDPALVFHGGRVIQAVRTSDNYIYTRYSSNGTKSWSSWVRNDRTSDTISLVSAGSKVVEAARGVKGTVLTRYSTNNGSSWSSWDKDGAMQDYVEMEYDSSFGRVFQAIRGTDNKMYYRYSDDGGVSWSNWSNSGTTSSAVDMLTIETADW